MYKDNLLFIKTLGDKKLTLALAESVTCGMAAQSLSTCKGVKDVLKASLVCYTAEAKKTLLGVPQTLMDKYTCESAEVTAALVRGLKKKISADVYAGITGLASEGGSETKEKPVGTVFFCYSYHNKLHHHRFLFRGTPLEIRKKACSALYRLIMDEVGRK